MKSQRYKRDVSLIPLSPNDLRDVERAPFHALSKQEMLVYNQSASDFFFAFDPEQDIALFMKNAFLADRKEGLLRVCHESIGDLVGKQAHRQPSDLIIFYPGTKSLQPLLYKPIDEAMHKLANEKEYRGKITVCSCGEEACGSEYAWIRDSVCIALFIFEEYLQEVALYPFRIEVRE